MKRAESDFVLVPKSAHSKNMLVFSLQRRVIIQEAKSRISQGSDMFESGLVIFYCVRRFSPRFGRCEGRTSDERRKCVGFGVSSN